MWLDFLMILVWWFVWIVFGILGWLWIRRIFSDWADFGYAFGKITGVIMVSFLVWLLGMAKIIPFGVGSIVLSAAVVFILGKKIDKKYPVKNSVNMKVLLFEEFVFFVFLLAWSFVKGHEPNISGLEKFMDFGFMKSILESRFFPPADMWFAGKSINYYYFGHLYSAVLTKISGINLAYTFNLMLSTIFALTGLMGGSIAYKILGGGRPIIRWAGMGVCVYILLLGGNLHTIYSFTKGYTSETPVPFWEIWGKTENTYWYPNATRFIPYTIHEFPAYSFVVSDIHGHVLDIPIVLLLIALMISIFCGERKNELYKVGLIGFAAGCAFMTNALDALVYLGLFLFLFIVKNYKERLLRNGFQWKKLLLLLLVFVATILPFLTTFKSFVNGIAVNCPPALLSNSRIGILVFEEVEKCQRSPIWMLFILWGLFVYGVIWLLIQREKNNLIETGMLLVALFCLGLVIFPEFFYFRDIYPLHFRSNTMFKFGYQVFILMTFVFVYPITKALTKLGRQWWMFLWVIPLLYLTFLYPLFSIEGYFGEIKLNNYKGLNGVEWIRIGYPDNYAVLNWIAANIPTGTQPVILEANGDSYTDNNMFSVFSGLPTVAGWTVHEWLWREGYSPIAERAEEVRKFYEEDNIQWSRDFLVKYQIKYVVVSNFEREKYPYLNLNKIKLLATPVFISGETHLYRVNM